MSFYLKCIKKSGDVKVTGKSRVPPLKNTLTICRLELMGNLILSRLVGTLIKAFKKYLAKYIVLQTPWSHLAG